MKKILTTVLAAVLVLQAGICAVAAPTTVLNPVYDVETPITLTVQGPNDAVPVSETTISEGATVGFIAAIDMENVQNQFATTLALGRSQTGNMTAGRNVPVTGNFAVTLNYPTALTLPSAITAGVTNGGEDMAGFNANAKNAFTEIDRTLAATGSVNTLTINFKVKDGITGGVLEDNPDTYLGDMYIETYGVTVEKTGAPHTVTGHISGSVRIDYTGESYAVATTVNFENETDPEAIINVLSGTPGPGVDFGGGGSSTVKYTVTFNTNNGLTTPGKTFVSGEEITAEKLPVPTRNGYTFAGWYMDENLNVPLTSFKLTKNITLHAAWVASDVPGDYTPAMLNGDDHFAYIIGYPDGTVQPNGTITRAEVATIFFRLLKDDIREANLTYENDFVDVNEGQWFNGAISTLTKMGILKGKDAEVFMPNADITRGEFAAIVARFAEQEKEIAEDFIDVDDHWAESDIYKAASLGWIKGYEDGSFRPNAEITRAEVMTLINRVLIRLPKSADDLLDGMATWSDNADENVWFYLAVQEATNSHDYVRDEEGFETWKAIKENRDWSTYEKK